MALLFVVGAAGACAVSGLAADTKPTPTNLFTFYETDTGRNYLANGVSWDLVLNPDYATEAQGATADSALQPGGALGTPSSGVATNLTGTAANLTAGNATLAATVTTNANLTGHVTSTGNAAVLGSFTIAQLSTAISDANISGNNTGDQTSIVGISGTIAQFNTALSDGDFATGGGTATGANTGDNATNSQYVGATSFKRTFALMGA